MNVLNFDKQPSKHMNGQMPRDDKRMVFIALMSALGSAAASVLIVGVYVGQFRSTLDNVAHIQETDRQEFKNSLSQLSSLVSTLNANLAGVNVGLKDLTTSLSNERQDRLNAEVRNRTSGK